MVPAPGAGLASVPVLVWRQLLIARLILLSTGQTFGHVGPCEKAAYGRQVGTILSGPRGLSNVGLHKKLQINSWTNISVLRFPEIVDGCPWGPAVFGARECGLGKRLENSRRDEFCQFLSHLRLPFCLRYVHTVPR